MVMPVQYSTMSGSGLITRNLMVRAYAEDDFPDQAPSLFHELQVPGIRFYIETVRSILPVVLAEKILIPTLTALVTLAVLPALPSPHLQWNHKLHVYKSSTGQSLGSVRANDVNEVHTLHGMLRLDFDQNVSDVPPSLHEISLKQSTPLSNILHTHPSSPLIPLMFRHSHANEIPCAHPPVHHSHYYPHPAMQRPPPPDVAVDSSRTWKPSRAHQGGSSVNACRFLSRRRLLRHHAAMHFRRRHHRRQCSFSSRWASPLPPVGKP